MLLVFECELLQSIPFKALPASGYNPIIQKLEFQPSKNTNIYPSNVSLYKNVQLM